MTTDHNDDRGVPNDQVPDNSVPDDAAPNREADNPRSGSPLRVVRGGRADQPDPHAGSPGQFQTYGTDVVTLNDSGLAKRWRENSPLAANWKFIKGRGWVEWIEGMGWRLAYEDDKTGPAVTRDIRVMLDSVHNFYLARSPTTPEERRSVNEALTRFKPASLARTLAGVLLGDDGGLITDSNQWDATPHLLGLPGGKVVDLRTGLIRDVQRSDFITRATAVAPVDLDAALAGRPTCTRWTGFLHQVMEGEEERIDFQQRWGGYCLTGETSEHSMLFLHGSGANGKSVFLAVVAGLLGAAASPSAPGYYATIDSEVLMTKRGSGGTPDYVLAELAGARAVVVYEVPQNASWDLGLLKKMVDSSADLTARSPYGRPFSYRPRFKLLVAGNDRPSLRGSAGQAVARRIHLLGFNYRIPDDQQDKKLPEKLLEAEGGAILSWMIAGAVAWYRAAGDGGEGLRPPASVRELVQEYIEDEDTLGQFLRDVVECVEQPAWQAEYDRRVADARGARSGGKAPARAAERDLTTEALFTLWEGWSVKVGSRDIPSARVLGARLSMRPDMAWRKDRGSGWTRWCGVRRKADPERGRDEDLPF